MQKIRGRPETQLRRFPRPLTNWRRGSGLVNDQGVGVFGDDGVDGDDDDDGVDDDDDDDNDDGDDDD